MKAIGTRQEVWDGKSDHTASGLTKNKFKLNSRGKIVSKARSLASQKNVDRLRKYQFSKKGVNGERRASDKSAK